MDLNADKNKLKFRPNTDLQIRKCRQRSIFQYIILAQVNSFIVHSIFCPPLLTGSIFCPIKITFALLILANFGQF